MPKWVKRLAAMLDDPNGHTYDEAASVLENLGFDRPRKPQGSHRWWRHPSGARVGLVDSGRGTMPVEYVKGMVQTLQDRGLLPPS